VGCRGRARKRVRDWLKAALVLGPITVSVALICVVIGQLVKDPVEAGERRIHFLSSSWPFTFLPRSWWWWTAVTVVLAAVVVYIVLRVLDARKERSREFAVTAEEQAATTRTLPLTHVSIRDAGVFRDALIHPSKRFRRITESVEPFTRSLLVRTTYVLRTDDLAPHRKVVLPILLNARGHLENGVAFSEGDGGRLSSLNRDETVDYVAAVVWQLIRAAGPGAAIVYATKRDGTSLKNRVRRILESEQAHPRSEAATSGSMDDLDHLRAELLSTRLASSARLYDIVHMMTVLRSNHPVCLALEPRKGESGPRRISVERRVIPGVRVGGSEVARTPAAASSDSEPGAGAKLAGWLTSFARQSLDWLRRLAGVTPSVLTHELTNASRAESYHLSFAGPGGYYAARFRLVGDRGFAVSTTSMGAQSARVAPLRGQRHAHLYVRGATRTAGLGFQVAFFERTPGSMAVALAASLATLAIASMIAASQVAAAVGACAAVARTVECLGSDPARAGDSGTLLQILLTFPIALVAISFTRSSDVWGGVLVARVVNGAVVGLSVIALALSTFAAAFTPNGLSVAWIAVIGAMLVVFVGSLASWAQRVLVHAAYIAQRV